MRYVTIEQPIPGTQHRQQTETILLRHRNHKYLAISETHGTVIGEYPTIADFEETLEQPHTLHNGAHWVVSNDNHLWVNLATHPTATQYCGKNSRYRSEAVILDGDDAIRWIEDHHMPNTHMIGFLPTAIHGPHPDHIPANTRVAVNA